MKCGELQGNNGVRGVQVMTRVASIAAVLVTVFAAAVPATAGPTLDAIKGRCKLVCAANGNRAGTGILWALVPLNGDANQQRGVLGILLALDAQDVSRTLWTSEQFAQRDRVGVLEGNPFGGGEMRGFCIGFEREDFFIGDAQGAAHGSVDVLSKYATVERGDAAVDQAP